MECVRRHWSVSAKAARALGRFCFCMRRKRWGIPSGSDSEPSPGLEAGYVWGCVSLLMVVLEVVVVVLISSVAPPRWWRMNHGLRIAVSSSSVVMMRWGRCCLNRDVKDRHRKENGEDATNIAGKEAITMANCLFDPVILSQEKGPVTFSIVWS